MSKRNTIEKAIDGSEAQKPVLRLNEWRTFLSDRLPLRRRSCARTVRSFGRFLVQNGVQTAATNNRSQALRQMFLTGHSLRRSSNQPGEPGANGR
jgi:hypothetical protein